MAEVDTDIDEPQVDDQQPDGGLPDDKKSELKAIVSKMIANKEPDDKIKSVVEYYGRKYGGSQMPAWKADATQTMPSESQPVFNPQIKTIPANVRSTEDIRNDQLKQKQQVAQDFLHSEMIGNNDVAAKVIKNQKYQAQVQQNSSNLANTPASDSPLTPVQKLGQSLQPQQSTPTVTDDDINSFKQSMNKDKTGQLARGFLKQVATAKPEKAKEIQQNTYLNDAANRVEQDPDKVAKVLDNYNKLGTDNYSYDPQTQTLHKLENMWESIGTGLKEKQKAFEDYDFFKNATPARAIAELNTRMQNFDPDEPVPVPATFMGKLTGGLASQPFGGMVAGKVAGGITAAIPGAEEAAPAVDKFVTAALTGMDFKKIAKANLLQSNYADLVSKGVPDDQAYQQASQAAEEQSNIEGAGGAAMMAIGGKIGEIKIPKFSLSDGYVNAVKTALKTGAKGIGEAGAVGLIQGQVAQAKSEIAQEHGITTGDTSGDIGSAIKDGILFTLGIAGIGKGLEMPMKAKNVILQGLSRVAPEKVDEEIGNQILANHLTPQEGQQAKSAIDTHSALDSSIPENVDVDSRMQIHNLIGKRTDLENQLESADKAFHPAIKEKINAVNDQILELSKSRVDKNNSDVLSPNFSREKTVPQQQNSVNLQENLQNEYKSIMSEMREEPTEEGKSEILRSVPQRLYERMAKDASSDTSTKSKGQLQELRESIQKAWSNNPDAMRDLQESKFTDASSRLLKTIGSSMDVSGMSHGSSYKNDATSDVPIEINNDLKTIDYGNYKGKPENETAKEEINNQILNNKPIGETGDTFSGFLERVIPATDGILKNEDHNTVAVTNSSAIKAMQIWEEMGKPDVNEITKDPAKLKDFAQKFIDKKTVEEGEIHSLKGEDGKQIHVVRHGETEDNVASEFREDNTQLTSKGQKEGSQAGKDLKSKLNGDSPPKIISPDLDRTMDTAKRISEKLAPTENFQKGDIVASNHFEGTREISHISDDGKTAIVHNTEKPHEHIEVPVKDITLKVKQKDNATAIRSNSGQVPATGNTPETSENIGSENLQSPQTNTSGNGKTVEQTGQEAQTEPSGTTGIKKTITVQERGERGLPAIALNKLGSDSEILKEGKEAVDSGRINPREVAARVIEGKGIYTPEEAGAMQYYGHQLAQAEKDIRDELNAHPKNSPEHLQATNQLQQHSDDVDAFTEANRINSRSWSNLGNVMQIEADQSFQPVNIRSIIKENYNGEIPKEVQGKIDEALAQRDKAIDDLRKAKEQMAADRLKKDSKFEERQTRRKQTKEELKKEREDIIGEIKKGIKKDLNNLNSGIPIPTETLTAIGKLALNYFKDGIVTVEGLTDKIYNDLKDLGIEKKAVREAISNYKSLRYDARDKAQTAIETKAKATWNKVVNEKLEPLKKSNIVFDKSLKYRQAENDLAKAEFALKQLKRKSFESQKNWYQYGLMWLGRLFRLGVLSGTNVLAKLTSAAVVGGAGLKLPREAIGGIYSKIFSGVAKKAPIEGGFNLKSNFKFYKEFVNPKKFADNTWQILRQGESRLNQKFGEPHDHIPLLYLPTDLHQIIKDPLKRAAFESARENRLAHASSNGYDINEPLIVNSAENAAYKRANYEIFQESNSLSRALNEYKGKLENEGNVGATKKLLIDFMVPVSTVPTNIARRIGSYSPAGLIRGSAKVVNAYRKGIENLSEDEAESTMRALKQGSLGTALWLAGWFGYKSYGGLYTQFNPNKNRNPEDLKSDMMQVNGEMIPKPVQHAIPLETIQLAATARRIYEQNIKKGDNDFQALLNAGLGSIGAIGEQIPIIDEGVQAVMATKDPYDAKKLKENMESRVVPQILKETGVVDTKKTTDKKSYKPTLTQYK